MLQETLDKTVVTEPVRCTYNIYWSAIILSALVGIGLSYLLYILTIGIGLSVFTLNETGQISLVMGGLIWLLITSYLIMFLVGWIASTLARPYSLINRCSGMLHGFAAWCLALVITIAIFSPSVESALGTPVYYGLNTPTAITSKANPSPQPVTTRGNSGATKEAINKLGVGVLGVFFVFLSGALGAVIGGYVASDKRFVPNERIR